MQIRCQQCHRPFAINKPEIHSALDEMDQENQNHYNVSCPHCRKMNTVTKRDLLRYAPDWQKKEPTNPE